MSAFNVLAFDTICPYCRMRVTIALQFKYADTWQIEYRIGDKLKWGGNDIGRPGKASVVVDAAAEDCPQCGHDLGDYDVFVEHDVLMNAREASGEYKYGNADYLVLQE